MRLRRRHAWGAVLIVLFALPVLRPEGFPSVERPGGSFLGWFARTPLLSPQQWRAGAATDEPASESPLVRALERDRAQIYEARAQEVDRRDALGALASALAESGLDRLPTVRPARVIRANDPSGFRRGLLIDRGAEDGLEEGCAVVQGDVLLGRVRFLQGRSALVQLVTDPHSRIEVAVRTEKDRRVRGFLHGAPASSSTEELEIRFAVVKEETGAILVNAPVFTSNADDRVPAGLLVGFVSEVSDPDVDGMPLLRMRPAMEIDRALDVFVVLPR
jgi:hypothetical protein